MVENQKEDKPSVKATIVFICPECGNQDASIIYDYGRRKSVCGKCSTPVSDFRKDYRRLVADEL